MVPGTSFIDLRAQALRLPPEKLIERLKRPFEPKFSAGIWYFGSVNSRFHMPYKDDLTIEERLEIAGELSKYGLKAVEAHYPWEINEDNIHLYKDLEKRYGVKVSVVGGIGGDFRQRDAQFGTLSSPIKEVRDKYLESTIRGLELAKELKALAVCWPGIDGYTYSLGTLFFDMWDRFEAAIAKALDEVPGVRLALEPKPYEPAINNIYRTTSDGILMARDVESRLKNPENRELLSKGHAIVALNPEVGHVRMGFEDVAYAYARVLREARLAHVHLNSQPLGNYDQDLNVGVVAPETTEALLFVLRLHSYAGYLGIDINPERMPVQVALINCFNAVHLANGVVDNLDYEEVLDCYFNPDRKRGVLEKLLIEARAKGVDESRFVPIDEVLSSIKS
ncbi:MAG TPA: xylose isomerase [Candidatus Bathyarchaeota archaeon]|nr:MAG: xylose isomerase [Candidatus Bathyarchaeota archaeon]HDN01777.1 xylose isomerase [Candidatus Bathyarchaeota archaeon]